MLNLRGLCSIAVMKQCSKCKNHKPLTSFSKDKTSKNGLRSSCQDCHKQYYYKDKVAILKKQKLWLVDIRQNNKQKKKEYLELHPCIDCGNPDIRVLEFDHLRDKKCDVAEMLNKSFKWGTILIEIEKCEVRCANCHRIKHYKVSKNPQTGT